MTLAVSNRRSFANSTAAMQWTQVASLRDAPSWLTVAAETIRTLSRLPRDWDSYGSDPIQRPAIEAASKLLFSLESANLPSPVISPVGGGGIGIEWVVEDRELLFQIDPNGAIEYLLDIPGHGEFEGSIQSVASARDLVDTLTISH